MGIRVIHGGGSSAGALLGLAGGIKKGLDAREAQKAEKKQKDAEFKLDQDYTNARITKLYSEIEASASEAQFSEVYGGQLFDSTWGVHMQDGGSSPEDIAATRAMFVQQTPARQKAAATLFMDQQEAEEAAAIETAAVQEATRHLEQARSPQGSPEQGPRLGPAEAQAVEYALGQFEDELLSGKELATITRAAVKSSAEDMTRVESIEDETARIQQEIAAIADDGMRGRLMTRLREIEMSPESYESYLELRTLWAQARADEAVRMSESEDAGIARRASQEEASLRPPNRARPPLPGATPDMTGLPGSPGSAPTGPDRESPEFQRGAVRELKRFLDGLKTQEMSDEERNAALLDFITNTLGLEPTRENIDILVEAAGYD